MKLGALFSILWECTIRRTRNSIKWRIKGDTKNCIDDVTANFFDVVIFLVLCFFPDPSFIARLYLLLELYQIYFMTDMNRVPEVVITPRQLRLLACVWSLELLNEFKIDRNRWNFCRVLINLVGFTLAKPVIV